MSTMGAATPPASTAPASQGISAFTSFSPGFMPRNGRDSIKIDNPIPLPRYSKAAMSTGSITPKNILDTGALAPKSTAPTMAMIIG